MPELEKGFPIALRPDLLTWMNITWAFKLKAQFETLTRIAVQQSKSKMKEEIILPIPDAILESIDTHRQNAISDLIALINGVLATLSEKTVCGACKFDQYSMSSNVLYHTNIACDGLVMGTMIKSLSNCRLWPLPQLPYEGFSVQNVAHSLRNLTILSFGDLRSKSLTHYQSPPEPTAHGWKQYFVNFANKIEGNVKGLDLDSLTSMDSSHWQKR